MDDEQYYKTAMNRWYADSGEPVFTRFVLEDVSEHNLEKFMPVLKKWESKGYVRIIKPPLESTIDEPCIEMLKRVE